MTRLDWFLVAYTVIFTIGILFLWWIIIRGL